MANGASSSLDPPKTPRRHGGAIARAPATATASISAPRIAARVRIAAAAMLVLLAGTAHASAACDPSDAAAVVERYLAAIQSPADCKGEMARLLDIAEDDVRECPDASAVPSRVEFETEFLRRTSARFVRVREADGGWVADIAYRGPDPEAVQTVALTRSPFCPQAEATDAESGESQGLWTKYRPEGLSCDPVDWEAIPVVDEQGALPLACRAGRWLPTPRPELGVAPAD